MMVHCEVMKNCLNNHDCWQCDNYGMYKPKDKRIKSKRQLDDKLEAVLTKKAKKQSDPSKRGKSNRRNGRLAEREVENLLKHWGLDARRVPCSGALKAYGLIPQLKDKMDGDIKLEINGVTLTVECKRNVTSNAWYKLANSSSTIKIEEFCYLMNDGVFQCFIGGSDNYLPILEVPDKRFKKLHTYFEQDNSDMVIVTRPYLPPIFFLTQKSFDLLKGVCSNG